MYRACVAGAKICIVRIVAARMLQALAPAGEGTRGRLTPGTARVMVRCGRARLAIGFETARSHIFGFGRVAVAPTGSDGMDHRPHIVVVEDEITQRRILVDY